MATHEKGFALCVRNQGAEDLDVRKVYRVLPDRAAAAEGYLRIIDESGDDYLYPAEYFVFLELPQKAKRALGATQRRIRRRPGSSTSVSWMCMTARAVGTSVTNCGSRVSASVPVA